MVLSDNAKQDLQSDNKLIESIKGLGNSKQAIIVYSDSFDRVDVTIKTFQNANGVWEKIDEMPGVVGKAGFTIDKKEGDMKSPVGIFSLGTAFGKYDNPGTKLPYRRTTLNDFWVDDSNSMLYNTWQAGPSEGRWISAENLLREKDSLYDYGFVINYNTLERISEKGSAIFFHVWRDRGNGTGGCVATTIDNVIKILKWLNPSYNPVIVQGPMSEILKL